MKSINVSITGLVVVLCIFATPQFTSAQTIQIDIWNAQGAPSIGGGSCHAQDLELEGLSDLCPGEITYVDIEGENTFPSGGGQGIRFTNYDDIDFVISGMDYPYSFDNDINGVLSQNGMDPLEGSLTLYSVTYTNAGNVTGSICDESTAGVNLYFYPEDFMGCNDDPCFAQELVLLGESELCPDDETPIAVDNPNTVPTAGGQGVKIYIQGADDILIPDVSYPYYIDNDLDGYLSGNGLDPLEGTYSLGSFVYSDANDPLNTICSQSFADFTITFLPSNHPDCIQEDCYAQNLVSSGTSICPMSNTSVNLEFPNTVPEGSAQGIRFTNGLDIDFILPVVSFPFVFNGSLNGYLAENGMDQIEGTIQLYSVVYNDPEDPQNSICSESTLTISIEFIPGDNAECMVCETEWMYGGPNSVCPGELTTIFTGGISVPTGGHVGLRCVDGEGGETFITDVSFPFDVDNDLNGLLSSNGLDPLVGTASFASIIYTDPNDIEGSICSESELPMSVNFLSPNDDSCVPCEVQALEILGPEFLCPDETTDLDFVDEITIPEGGGVGLRFEPINLFTTIYFSDVSFPYTVDNDLGGYLSANGMDPVEGWLIVRPFIYTDPNDPENSICMLGDQTDINFLFPDNSTCDPECTVEDFILTGPSEICMDETTTIDIPNTSVIPEGGGLGVRFSNGDDVNIIYGGATYPYEIDYDLNGALTDAGFDPFEGTIAITSFIYDDPNNSASICSESENPVFVTFLTENDPACVSGLEEYLASGQWALFPNPSSESTTIEVDMIKSENATIQVIDVYGREVKSFNKTLSQGFNNISIELDGLASGLYQVVFRIETAVASKPLMITNY